jgi:glycine oxidase
MSDLRDAHVAVVGGGVLGFSTALSLARAGARVVLYEAHTLGDNASGVAAGMLAPAFEAVLDPVSAGRFHLLRAARDHWPSFLEALELAPALDRSGALWAARPGDEDRLADICRSLTGEGASAEALSPAQIRILHPGLAGDVVGGVLTPEDWLLDPMSLLPAMRGAFQRLGGALVQARVEPSGDVIQVDGVALRADAVVLAAGAEASAWTHLAPELGVVSPVKGQILHLNAAPTGGPVVRGGFGYVAPQGRGAVVGATMQAGLSDRQTDAKTLAHLQAGAARLFPDLASVMGRGRAGVRASTPDGLPLVGRSSRSGLLLALGARRNGWLLGPMAGEMIVATLSGRDAGPYAAAFDPCRRFGRGLEEADRR